MKCPGSGEWVIAEGGTIDMFVTCDKCGTEKLRGDRLRTMGHNIKQAVRVPDHEKPWTATEWFSGSGRRPNVVNKDYHDSLVRELRITIDGLEEDNHKLRRDVYDLTRKVDEPTSLTAKEIAEIREVMANHGWKP